MDTQEAIRTRCSLKVQVSDRPVEPELIRRVLDAARLAPSARNLQPWRFVVVQGREAVQPLVRDVFFGPSSPLDQAPVLILACATPAEDVTISGKEYYLFDVGLAVENLLLAATDLGLVTHLIASYDETGLKKRLHIPDEVRVVIATPLAHPLAGSYEAAAEDRLARRTRKEARDIAYWGRWGQD